MFLKWYEKKLDRHLPLTSTEKRMIGEAQNIFHVEIDHITIAEMDN